MCCSSVFAKTVSRAVEVIRLKGFLMAFERFKKDFIQVDKGF